MDWQKALSDYSQLLEGYPNAKRFAQALRGNIEQNVPSQADFENPEAMSQWSQSAALNAPMGLTFAGKTAKNAPLDKFKEAELMSYKSGLRNMPIGSPEWMDVNKDIWQQTGIHFGVDMKPRFEIDDSKSFYKGGKQAGSSYLDNVFLHKDLYENYPFLENKRVKEFQGEGGSFDPRTGNYTIGLKNAGLTALHEIQHAIQGAEDFSKGGSANTVYEQLADEAAHLDNDAEKLYKQSEIGDILGPPKTISPLKKQQGIDFQRMASELRRRLRYEEPYNLYSDLAAEAEARAVEKRVGYSPEKRQSIFPLEDYDTPITRLIRIMRGQ